MPGETDPSLGTAMVHLGRGAVYPKADTSKVCSHVRIASIFLPLILLIGQKAQRGQYRLQSSVSQSMWPQHLQR